MRKLPIAAFIALVCTVLGGFLLTLQSCSSGSAPAAQHSTLDRVLSSGTIRAAYLVRPPNIIKNPNTGRLSGIFVDIVEEMARRQGLRVQWVEEVTWATMIEGLNSNRYDVVGTGIWRNATRGRAADFTIPLFYSGVGAFVRNDDHRFDSDLSLINNPGVRISTIDGEMAAIIARADFPNARTVSLTQVSDTSQMLLEVQTNKADVTFLAAQIGARYMQQNAGTIRNIAVARPIRVFPESLMIRTNDYAFKAMLDSAITELVNSDFVERTIARNDAMPDAYYLVANPYRPYR
ncbi:MAG TPA: transporter substrate-binding domain-containing protein [Allosphingosinicella sp.]|nr:transporter substrate-binding domain-containing protein [Allosphingosinicella sp.]